MNKYLLILCILNHFLSFIISQNLDEDELSDDIVILHVNDVHCGINDTIGYDGFVLYREEMKKKYKNVICVDVGDHIQGGALGTISNGISIIKIMNEVGFDVATLGNHEFDYGIEQLRNLENNITCEYICANFCYKKNKTQIFDPYKIINKGGKKIAFIGILTPLTFSKTYLAHLKDENGVPIYDFLTDNNTQELYDRIQNFIDKLKNEEKVDYVILLTHMGMNLELYTSNYLLSKIEGVNAILDGHTHAIYNQTSKDKNNNDIYIAQTGTKLGAVGKLILKMDGTISSEIITEIPEPDDKTMSKAVFRKNMNRWVDINMNNYINNIWEEYDEELSIVYGHLNFDMNVENVLCRRQECTLGNLITDAIKKFGNAEISLINGGSIRNSMKKGNLTRAQIINILPWFNNIVIKKLTGKCILDALEFGVAKVPYPAGSFLQVSGITCDVDESINSSVLIDPVGMFINVTGERRVSNVKINGVDLDLNKLYNVSLLEFISSGGDGFSMFTKFDVFNEALITDTDAFSAFIGELFEIPEKYKDLQGRINFIKKKKEPEPEPEPDTQPQSPSSSSLTIILIISIIIVIIIILILIFIFRGRICSRVDSRNIDTNKEIDINTSSPLIS